MPYLVTSSAVEKSHRIEQAVEISPFHCVSVEMTLILVSYKQYISHIERRRTCVRRCETKAILAEKTHFSYV